MTQESAVRKARKVAKEKGVIVGVVEHPHGYFITVPDPHLSLMQNSLISNGYKLSTIINE